MSSIGYAMNTDRMRYSLHFISTFFLETQRLYSRNLMSLFSRLYFDFFSRNLTSLISQYNDFNLEMVLFFYYCLALILFRSGWYVTVKQVFSPCQLPDKIIISHV